MIDPLFTLYCEDCEVAERPSRLWIRAEIEMTASDGGVETHHYIECMNCANRFKSCMEDHMEAVGDDEWSQFVEESTPTEAASTPDAPDAASPRSEGTLG